MEESLVSAALLAAFFSINTGGRGYAGEDQVSEVAMGKSHLSYGNETYLLMKCILSPLLKLQSNPLTKHLI